MNIDTGEITGLPEGTTETMALMRRLVPVDLSQMTEKQKAELRVRLADHTSPLGRQLTAWRSKYVPHIGAKQLAKSTNNAFA